MRLHDQFEWDAKKAEKNRKKHGITFDDAVEVLGDDQGDVFHVEQPDDEHSIDEDRTLTLGSFPDDRREVIAICWTDRSTDTEKITRIISARPVTPQERRRYAKEISDR